MKIKTLNDNAALNYDDIGDDYFDLLVVGFGGDERIRYAKELRGETNVLKNLARMAKL